MTDLQLTLSWVSFILIAMETFFPSIVQKIESLIYKLQNRIIPITLSWLGVIFGLVFVDLIFSPLLFEITDGAAGTPWYVILFIVGLFVIAALALFLIRGILSFFKWVARGRAITGIGLFIAIGCLILEVTQ